MTGSGSTLGELGQREGSGLDRAWWGVCIQTVSRSWGSDLGRGSWEDGTLMLWRLRSDFRLRRENGFACVLANSLSSHCYFSL